MNRICTVILLVLYVIPFSFAQKVTKDRISKNVDINIGNYEHEKISSNSEYDFRQVNNRIKYRPIEDFRILSKENPLRGLNYRDGKVSYIEGRIESHDKSMDSQINSFLKQASELLRIQNADTRFVSKDSWVDNLGQQHFKMQQHVDGVEIYGAEIILHADDGGVFLLNGAYNTDKEMENFKADFELTEEEVKLIVGKKLDNFQPNFLDAKTKNFFPHLEQWKITPVAFNYEGQLYSAYHVLVYANLAEYYTYFVDASDGSILRKHSNICRLCSDHKHCNHSKPEVLDGPSVATAVDLLGEVRTIDTWEAGTNFYMADGSRAMFQANSSMPNDGLGIILTINAFNTAPQNSNFSYDHFVSANNSWSNTPEAVSAHYNGGQSYEYYKNVHGRESISGDGQNIYSFVNVAGEDGNSMGNAFWNGAAIFYGNGDSAFKPLGRALDVAGHEISHGVIQVTANLDYYSESGAMNESFADIFGSMIDRDDWLIGEEVVETSVFTSGALRNMADPHNGQAFQDYGRGWQPAHVNEQYTGSQDNGGVHINSGIPNKAYYLFATDPAVGKEKAEQVFYRALTTYLTRSSNFADLRAAAERAAGDRYDSSVVNAVKNAFAGVGIGDAGGQTNYEEDVEVNPGSDFLMFSDVERSNLFLKDIASGALIGNPLSQTDHISRPSITDDGEEVIFVNSDNQLVLIRIDWSQPSANEVIWDTRQIWDRAVISKDGRRVAALTSNIDDKIYVYDDEVGGEFVSYDLYNPTFSEGITTGEVLFADAMEFDITGDYIVYDAKNLISSTSSGEIEYWDIGFINVWNSEADIWALGDISKLFNSIPEGANVANPTFAKNSPYIIALDFFDAQDVKILGVNVESGEVGEMFQNTELSWPSYSRDDTKLVHDLPGFFGTDVGVIDLNPDKISAVTNSEDILHADGLWGVWFSNGQRDITDVFDIEEAQNVNLFPNPASDYINFSFELSQAERLTIDIIDLKGKTVLKSQIYGGQGVNNQQLAVKQLPAGSYFLKLTAKEFTVKKVFVKI